MKLLNISILTMTYLLSGTQGFSTCLWANFDLSTRASAEFNFGPLGGKAGKQAEGGVVEKHLTAECFHGFYGEVGRLLVVCIRVIHTPELGTVIHIHKHNIPHRACPSVQLGTTREARDQPEKPLGLNGD